MASHADTLARNGSAHLTANSLTILKERYLARRRHTSDGRTVERQETVDDLWDRVSGGNSAFRNLLSSLRFCPNCLSLDTKIPHEHGVATLGDLQAGDLDMQVCTDDGLRPATACFDNGPRSTVRVVTTSGYSVVATPDHLFRIVDQHGCYVWKRTGDLRPGDWMALQKGFIVDDVIAVQMSPVCRRTRSVGRMPLDAIQPGTLTPDLSRVLGFYVGNGCLRDSGRFQLAVCGRDPDLATMLAVTMTDLFGVSPKVSRVPGKDCFLVEMYRKSVINWMHDNGLAKEDGARSARIPECVWNGGREVAAAFISGLFEADGSVGSRCIEFSSVSDRLIYDSQLLLLGLGICSRISRRDGKVSRLTIRKGVDGAVFAEEIGLLSRRKQDALRPYLVVSRNAKSHIIPNQRDVMKGWYSQHKDVAMYKRMARFMIDGPAYCEMSVEAYRAYAEEFPALLESPIAGFVDRDQFYDQVVAVEKTNPQPTADLHVPSNHTFIADGFVSHNSPTLFNMGLDNGCTSSACFVFSFEDAMLDGPRSIHNTRGKAAAVAKAGGGVGYYLGHLRAKGSLIKSVHRKACGPVAVLRDMHGLRSLITQGGKRDLAQMGVLNCDHPDVLEFIHCKDADPKALESFNISVAWSDEWVRRAMGLDGVTMDPEARYLWDEQCLSAWRTGCPGMFFPDRVNRDNPNVHLGMIEAPNPCVTGDTLLLIRQGWIRIAELIGERVEAWNGEKWSPVVPRVTGHNRNIIRVTFSDGRRLDCTENHRFYLTDGRCVEAKDLTLGSCLEGYRFPPGFSATGPEVVYCPRVVRWELIGKADTVYCATEPERGRLMFNGLLTAQCGETPNRDSEPCNLGSLRLSAYYRPGNRDVDWGLLEEDVWTATEFLDDILDRNTFPHPDITAAALLTRKLGLGVMDWAELLSLMHVHYDSQEAVDLGGRIAQFMQEVSHGCSERMAETKGPYAGYDAVKTQAPMRRNETTGSVAPTGTIAIITGCRGWSIEPFFALDVTRTTNEGIKMKETVDADRYEGFVPRVSHDIALDWHVRHQAAWQRFTDLGVSKTINLPHGATVEDVSRAYQLMYESGCKGGTIYRDGCREEQVLRANDGPARAPKSVYTAPVAIQSQPAPPADYPDADAEDGTGTHNLTLSAHLVLDALAVTYATAPSEAAPVPAAPPATPATVAGPAGRRHLNGEVPSIRRKFHVGDVHCYMHVGLFPDGNPAEVFMRAVHQGTTTNGFADAWAMAISNLLQHGMPLAELLRLYRGQRFEPCGLTGVAEIPICTSIPDFVVRWLHWRFQGAGRALGRPAMVSTDCASGGSAAPSTAPAGGAAVLATPGALPTGGRLAYPAEPESDIIDDGSIDSGVFCPRCGASALLMSNGCLKCESTDCEWSRCG